MSTPAEETVPRPLWWLAIAVFIAAAGLFTWLWVTPLATVSDLPGQTPLHDVSGR